MTTFLPVTGVKIPLATVAITVLPIDKRSGPLPSFSSPTAGIVALKPIYKRSGPLVAWAMTGAAWSNPLNMKPVPPLPGSGGGSGGAVGYPIDSG